MKKLFAIIIINLCSVLCFSQTYTTTSNVEILEGHTWYEGKILEVKGDKYKIHYNQYNNDLWDIWIGKERLRNANPKSKLQVNTKPVSGNGTLYSGSTGTGGSAYLFIYPSGQVVQGCPTGGLEKFSFTAYCSSEKSSCGTCIKTGNAINITWNTGGNWNGIIKTNGEIEMNSTLYGKVQRVPNKLSASYEFSLNSNGMSVAETTKFNEDGTYSVTHASGYDHNDGKNSAEWLSNSKGRYIINGFTISMIDSSGKTIRHTIYSLGPEKNPDYLGWDGNYLSKSNK
jgi:hypothetical protein